jgi:hypothetical protein
MMIRADPHHARTPQVPEAGGRGFELSLSFPRRPLWDAVGQAGRTMGGEGLANSTLVVTWLDHD